MRAGFDALARELARPTLQGARDACGVALTSAVAAHTLLGRRRSEVEGGVLDITARASVAFPADPDIAGRRAQAAAIARDYAGAARLFGQAAEMAEATAGASSGKAYANLSAVATAADERRGRLPRVVILGSQKSGSTTLAATLRRHPSLEQCAPRETHFFDIERVFACGRHWYRGHFARAEERGLWGLEKTPSYMAQPHAMERMREVLPAQTRFIVIVRDPVRRSWSSYYDNCRRREQLGGAPASLEEFETLMAAGWATPQGLTGDLSPLGRSYYGPQLRQARQILGADRVHILSLEELSRAPDETLGRVLEFLGLRRKPLQVIRRRTEKGRTLELPDGLRRSLVPIFAASDAETFELAGRQLY